MGVKKNNELFCGWGTIFQLQAYLTKILITGKVLLVTFQVLLTMTCFLDAIHLAAAESELSLWSAMKHSSRGAVQERDWPDSRARGPGEDAELDAMKASPERHS